MIDSTSITKKIEAHKSTIIEELSQTEEALKKELKRYEESLITQMKSDITKYHNSLNLQEQEQKQSIQKLLKMVGWKVLIPISLLFLIIGLFLGTQITAEPKQQTMYQKEVMKDKNGKAYIQFNRNELFYDQARQMYYYQIK